jgi:ATP-dependent Lon protease
MKQYLGNIPSGNTIEQALDLETCNTLSQLVDRVAYHFDLPLGKMQEFLEEQDVEKRAETLQSLIKLKIRLTKISHKSKDEGIDFSMN